METNNTEKNLPACPVETTLTLIGDKWKVLILRDLMPGTKRFGEKVHRNRFAKGTDGAAPRYGRKQSCKPQSVCRSSAESGILSDGNRQKFGAHPFCYESLGRRI